MARATCHAALVCCATSAVAPARAAEWSLAPTISWTGDHDSNRYLQANGTANESSTLFASLQLQRATETTQFSFSPDLRWQYFDTKSISNIFERDLTASGAWNGERLKLSLTGEDADQSSLTTEATQTGILNADLHRLTDQVSAQATYMQSERRSLILDLSYVNARYSGADAAALNVLSGYHEPSASLAERLSLSEQAALTASVFASDLRTPVPGNDTRQVGGQLDYNRTLSERTQVDVSGGMVSIHSPVGPQTSTIASVNLSHALSNGSVAAAYSRSVTPLGTGSLVLRQQWTLTATRGLTEIMDATASLQRVQNGQALNQVQTDVSLPQVQTYNSAQLGLEWRPAETWSFGLGLGGTLTRTVEAVSQPVHEWRVSVSVNWTPRRVARSF